MERRLGFGLLASLPLALLFFTVLAGIGAQVAGASIAAATMLMYTHFATQLLVLMIFGYLMVSNRRLPVAGKWLWGAFFLVFAPVAVPAYWFVHVWRAEPKREVVVTTIDLGVPEPAV